MITVLHGDMLQILPTLDAESVHAVVSDAPYHLSSVVKRFAKTVRNEKTVGKHAYGRHAAGFMGQTWDGGDIAFRPNTWEVVYRVMKPGAFMLVFAGTRGYHRMACAIEDAGFVIHPMLGWLFGTGFPKATRFKCSEAADWRYGLQTLKPAMEPICMAQKPMVGTGTANRLAYGCGGLNIEACRIEIGDEVVGDGSKNLASWRRAEGRDDMPERPDPTRPKGLGRWPSNICHDGSDEVLSVFPNTPGALAPVRPDSGDGRKTNGIFNPYAANSDWEPRRDYGSAARFMYCAKASKADRISRDVEEVEVAWISPSGPRKITLQSDRDQSPAKVIAVSASTDANEWNTFLSGNAITDLCRRASKCIIETKTNSTIGSKIWKPLIASLISTSTGDVISLTDSGSSHAANAGNTILSATIILGQTESLPGASHAASQTPLRISVNARQTGHATVKPVSLMSWLVKMVTPPGGTVLDPFAGTGTTLLAADRLRFNAIGIEQSAEYVADIHRRLREDAGMFADLFDTMEEAR